MGQHQPGKSHRKSEGWAPARSLREVRDKAKQQGWPNKRRQFREGEAIVKVKNVIREQDMESGPDCSSQLR